MKEFEDPVFRLKFYEAMLKRLLKIRNLYPRGLCSIKADIASAFNPYMRPPSFEDLPELLEQKPYEYERYDVAWWWHPFAAAPRIKALEKAIELTLQKINN